MGAPRELTNAEAGALDTPEASVYLIVEDPLGSTVMPTSQQLPIHSDPEILGGTPVFVGTRVPLQSLFDYLEAGDSLDEFIEAFPTVTREQAVAALEIAREAVTAVAVAH